LRQHKKLLAFLCSLAAFKAKHNSQIVCTIRKPFAVMMVVNTTRLCCSLAVTSVRIHDDFIDQPIVSGWPNGHALVADLPCFRLGFSANDPPPDGQVHITEGTVSAS
jgi:hypothetical protein